MTDRLDPERLKAIRERLEGWRENCAESDGDSDVVAIFEAHAAHDVSQLLAVSEAEDGGS